MAEATVRYVIQTLTRRNQTGLESGGLAVASKVSQMRKSICIISYQCTLHLSSLLQERMEMARMAEEVARQTAERAIREMAGEGYSIKLSLGSQELLEEPEAE